MALWILWTKDIATDMRCACYYFYYSYKSTDPSDIVTVSTVAGAQGHWQMHISSSPDSHKCMCAFFGVFEFFTWFESFFNALQHGNKMRIV